LLASTASAQSSTLAYIDYYGKDKSLYHVGKSIYASVELCADAVLANKTNYAAGQGYFFYSETEKLCRCCNAVDARANTVSAVGSNLY
jgi:hypothetical protein